MRPELPNRGEVCARDGMSDERAKVVIIGAGFGGIEAAKELRRASVELTVIDRQNHHCFQPLLYQVATAALSPADVAWPIRHILRKQKNATVLMAEVREIDPAKRRVQIDLTSISYDYLVLATGASHAYFGHDEWAEVAPGLKRIEDATRIRRRILIAFERAELAVDEAERQRLLTFVIVGGGATGVEMAGGISEVARWLDVQQDRAGRTRVGVDLSVPAHLNVFVIGDTATVVDQPEIPGTASAAKQMGRYVGRLIAAHAAQRPLPPPFRYRHMGDLATIGRQAPVVTLGRIELTGFLG